MSEDSEYIHTPFEFARKGDVIYVLTRESLQKALVENASDLTDSSIESALRQAIDRDASPHSGTPRAHVLVIEKSTTDKSLSSVFFGKPVSFQTDFDSRQFSLTVIIWMSGRPQKLTSHGEASIHYWFDLGFRYRSSIYWPNSGRPCPLCCDNLWRATNSPQRANLSEAARLIPRANRRSAPGVTSPTPGEVAATVQEALALGQNFEEDALAGFGGGRASCRLNLSTWQTESEIFPVDPACPHKVMTYS